MISTQRASTCKVSACNRDVAAEYFMFSEFHNGFMCVLACNSVWRTALERSILYLGR